LIYNNFNIANILSIFRMFSGFPLIICLENMNHNPIYMYYSIWIVIFIVLSDVLDGFFARKFKYVTSFGKTIDPVADKICLMCVLIYLIDTYQLTFLIFFILLSIRDVVLISFTVFLALYKDIITQANGWGKFFIFVTMIMLLFHIYNLNYYIACILYVLSTILLIISMIVYIRENIEKINSNENI